MREEIDGKLQWDFPEALTFVLGGTKMHRRCWPKGIFIFFVTGTEFKVTGPPLIGTYTEGTEIKYNSHIDMVISDGSISPWTPSQIDMVTTDWEFL